MSLVNYYIASNLPHILAVYNLILRIKITGNII